jgi:phage protein D
MGLGIAIRVNGAPDDTAASATSVEVTERVGQPTSYRIEYALDTAGGDFPLLKEGRLGPGSELSILASSGSATECLVKGPVYGQQIRFEQGGSGSVMSVLGADSLIKLDREDKVAAWSNLTDSAAATAILSQAGFVPDVDSTQAGHLELKHTLIQRETDLAFVRRLARRNGNLLWLTANELGIETAHFKRPVLQGNAACDLVINLVEPRSNVTLLEMTWDIERPTEAKATEVDLNNKSDISGDVQRSPLTALGGSGLADIATGTRVAHVYAPVDDNGDLQARSEAAVIEASFFVRATGNTTVSALGKVLRSHTLVNLRGVGSRHSGLWFCSAVRHEIDSTEHKMEFELMRNGWAN